MNGEISGARRHAGLALGLIVMALGCAPGLEGRWQGTGEREEARFFQFALDLESSVPSALWLGEKGAEMRLAVCAVVRFEDGTVQFQLDPETPALACDDLKRPLTFKGSFGRDVLAGAVLDGDRTVGRFRAFRTRD